MSLKLVIRKILVAMIVPAMMMAVLCTSVTVVATEDTEMPEEEETPVDEDAPVQVQSDILQDAFGEVVFYRWERVYRNDYPTDLNMDWQLAMLVWSRDGGKKDDGYIGALAPECIWAGPNAAPVAGVTNRFDEDDPYYEKEYEDDDEVLEDKTYYIRCTDRAEGIDVGSDPQVLTNQDVFYTDDDRDCLWIKYGGTDDDNEGLDENDAPVYAIKLSRTIDAPQDYILHPYGEKANAAIMIESSLSTYRDKNPYEWSFQSVKSNQGDRWRIFYNKSDYGDPELYVGPGKRFGYVSSDSLGSESHFKWFKGTKLRYSAIKGNPTVGAGQMLSVSESNYVANDGSGESQNGVILPSGQTITIEKGGILSISGDFINNGTIINNGGAIIVQNGGNIYPFLQGDDANSLGCGTIKCNGGDIIVEEGGAIYAGLNTALSSDNVRRSAPFWMDNSATLINYGLVCCGEIDLGQAATIENRSSGYMYTCMWEPKWGSFCRQLRDNNRTLMSGSTNGLINLGYFKAEDGTNIGGICIINGPNKLANTPSLYVTKGLDGNINNPDEDWQSTYINQGLIYYGILEL